MHTSTQLVVPEVMQHDGWDFRISFQDLVRHGHQIDPIGLGYNDAVWVNVAGIGKSILLKGFTHCVRCVWNYTEMQELYRYLSFAGIRFTCKPRMVPIAGMPGVVSFDNSPICF